MVVPVAVPVAVIPIAIIATVEIGSAINVKLVSGDCSVPDIGSIAYICSISDICPVADIRSIFDIGPVRDSASILSETLAIFDCSALAHVQSLSCAGLPAEISAVARREI